MDTFAGILRNGATRLLQYLPFNPQNAEAARMGVGWEITTDTKHLLELLTANRIIRHGSKFMYEAYLIVFRSYEWAPVFLSQPTPVFYYAFFTFVFLFLASMTVY